MFELATLGLLLQEPLHGYRLKQQLEQLMSGCISVNYGTIYPLLKRLCNQGAIAILPMDEKDASAHRKIYAITEMGRTLWYEKMLAHPQESWVNARARFLIKFFFFAHLPPSDRAQLLNHRLMVCQLRLDGQPEQPETLTDVYQSAAWQRCRQTVEAEIHWLQAQLAAELSHQSSAAD